jgi:polar amino acid transport system substrate-binding protein
MLKNCLRLVVAVLVAIVVMAAVSNGYAADQKVRALLPSDVTKSGVLRAAMPLDFEPFNYLDEKNQEAGLDVDIFRAIAGVLGLKPTIERMAFASVIPSIKGQRVDVGMSAMGIRPDRLQAVSFVRYGYLTSGLIVRTGNPTQITTDNGCGHVIALEKGTYSFLLWTEIAKKCEQDGKAKINMMILDGKGPQVLAVETGRAEAAGFGYAASLIVAKQSHGKLAVAPGGPVPGGTVPCGIAFNKERPELGKAIEAALEVLVKNGSYDKIFAKWGLSAERAEPGLVE